MNEWQWIALVVSHVVTISIGWLIGSVWAAERIMNEMNAEEEQIQAEPTQSEVYSACLSFRHDFGLLAGDEREAVRLDALEWRRAWMK